MTQPSKAASVNFVDTAENSRAICAPLLEAAANSAPLSFDVRVALDLEGRDLGPSGAIAILSLATSQNDVALFDFADPAVANALLDDGLLRDVLTHPGIAKLTFDCRMDVGALFYQFDVKVAHAVDLQIAAVLAYNPTGRYLMGMHKTFTDKLRLFTPDDAKVKDLGRKLFAPEAGGDYEMWFKRPMATELQLYCAVDVKYFFAAAQLLLRTPEALAHCAKMSLTRTTLVTTRRIENCSPHRDF